MSEYRYLEDIWTSQEGTQLITEELNALTQKNRGAYLVELSHAMEYSENRVEFYRNRDIKTLVNNELMEYVEHLKFAHDYLLEKVKYLEEERFKECLKNG